MEFFHHKTKYPFMATRRRWYLVSAILIVAALTSFAVRGLNLGIDFTGGVVLELEFAQDANLEKIRTSLEDAGFAHAAVQSFGTSRDVMVRLLPQEGEDFSAESGRGLFLVDSFADSWGWQPLSGSLGGKVVWALFRLHTPAE